MLKEKKRKVRSDKKHDIKPTINKKLHDCIHRLNYITYIPIKDIGVEICEKGLGSRNVIELLSKRFRRNYQMEQTLFIGDPNIPKRRRNKEEGGSERITLRFSQTTADQIAELAFALDVTPSSATAILLDAAVRNTNIVNEILKKYVEETLDENRLKELNKVLEFINKNNPYDEEITLSALLSYLFEELMDNTRNIKKVIGDWLERYK